MAKYFGTDGIRGRAGVKLHPEFVTRVAYAFTKQLGISKQAYAREGRPRIVVGYDSRLSGPMLKSAVLAGLNLGGCDVLELGLVPTPLVPLSIHAQQAAGGVMITASHNPVPDNGIKLFGGDGFKLSPAKEAAIETTLEDPQLPLVEHKHQFGQVTRYDPSADYLALARKLVPIKQSPRKLHLVLDCAHGATCDLAQLVFEQAGFKLSLLSAEFDGNLVNVKCGATDTRALAAEVVRTGAAFGLAFDGDGDRVLAVDHTGQPVSGDKIIALFATRLKRYRLEGAVVMTKMTNMGVEDALQAKGIKLHRTEVGDIQVLAKMRKAKLHLGGEQSGHIIMLDRVPTGDGILAGLQLAQLVRNSKRSLSQLVADFSEYPQRLTNLQVADKTVWQQQPAVQRKLKQIQQQFSDVRFYLRPSGTEDLIRVLTEAKDAQRCSGANLAVCELLTGKAPRA